jgi:hypothetical protein
MRSLFLLVAGCIALPLLPAAFGQEPAHKLNLVIVEGDGAINNIRQRTAREPIVQVEDENHKPVAGAAVLFLLPGRGAGGTFADGSHSLSVVTDSQGRAVAHGLRVSNVKGQFHINVTATSNGMTATNVITQTTVAAGGGGSAATAGVSTKIIVIIAIAAAAAAGGAYYATHSGSSGNNGPPAASTSITAGTGSVGPPK